MALGKNDASRWQQKKRLRRWISLVRARNQDQFQGRQTASNLFALSCGLWLLGALVGWGMVISTLSYDGSQPINILQAILILVGSQLFALLILLVLKFGGFRHTLQSLSVFNPASLLMRSLGVLRRKSDSQLGAMGKLATSPLLSSLKQPLLIYLAQHFTIGLNLSMVAGLIYLATISDLAFGWNTTLNMTTDTAYQGFQWIAWPWKAWLPMAVPSEELVGLSRYYRLQGELNASAPDAGILGTWWLYLLMTMLCYGLIPRLIVLLVSGSAYDRSILRALHLLPGANQVLTRMDTPLVLSEALSTETGSQAPSGAQLRVRQYHHPLPCHLVEWGAFDHPAETPLLEISEQGPKALQVDPVRLERAGIKPLDRFKAGGYRDLSTDKELVRHLSSLQPEGVAILVKAWESPTLDCADFVAHLAAALNPTSTVIVLLVGLDQGEVSGEQLQSWESLLLSAVEDGASASEIYVECLRS